MSRPVVLLVDDEPDILVALEDLLEDRYEVLTAGTPFAALEMLKQRQVDVIVSDQRMPGMTGDAMLAQARTFSDAQAILLTGYADLSAVISALNTGGIGGYAAKPWEPQALLALVAGAAERSRLARELRVEQSLLQALMDHVPAGIAFKDHEGRLLRLNSIKAERLGVTREAALNRVEADFLAPDAARALRDVERAVLETLTPVQTLDEVVRDGRTEWLQTTHLPLFHAVGGVERMVVFERDVTEERQIEARLRQSDKLQALGTLAGGVAHDFNNLLTAILGSLDLAARRLPEDERLRRYIDNASQAAQKGAALTQRLLGFSRQREPSTERIDVNALVAGMRDLLVRSLGGNVQLTSALGELPKPACADPEQLELAILNLCVNARDAMPGGGALRIATRAARFDQDTPEGMAAGDYVAIEVADEGEGMSPEVAARIFEPFFTTKDVGKGTGLGLSMVYGFVQRSQGGIMVDTAPQQGTTFTLFLPCAEPVQTQADEPPAPPTRPPVRVLVIDDDDSVRAVTAEFVRQFGDTVVEAPGVEAALERLAEHDDIAVAVVDFSMPGLNGMAFIRSAREAKPGLPIVMVSGLPDIAAASHAVMLRKPFSRDELALALAQALSHHQP